MKFDANIYLYYTLMNDVYTYYDNKDKLAEKLLEVVGDVSLHIGQLEVEEKGKYGRTLRTGHIGVQNKDLFIVNFAADMQGNIEVIGDFQDSVMTKINIQFNYIDDDHSNIDLLTASKDDGLYFFTTRMTCYESFKEKGDIWEPCYVYYNDATYRWLIDELKLKEKDIESLTPHKLYTMGVLPDKFGFCELKDLGYSNAIEMAHDIFTRASFDDIKEKFDNIKINEEKTAKHLEKSKQTRRLFNI